MSNNKLVPHLYLLAVAFIYGANYTIAKDVMSSGLIKPMAFILCRVLAGVILFWATSIFIKEKIERKDHTILMICALTGVVINQTLFFYGLHLGSVIHASLIMTATPILVVAVSWIMLKEAITYFKIGGVLLGCSGAILLILQARVQGQSINEPLGNAFIFINAVSFAVYLVLVKKLTHKYHPVTISKWVFLYGSILCIPLGLYQIQDVVWSDFDMFTWMSFLYVLIFTTFLAYLLNALALKQVSASTVSVYIYLQPLIAVLIALTLQKDQLDGVKILAAVLIFSGVYLSGKKMKVSTT